MSEYAAELSVPGDGTLSALEQFLRLVAPDAEVTRVAGQPAPGQQGWLDVLALAGSSPVIMTAIRVLPRFLETRKPGLSVKVKVKNTVVEVSGATIDEAMRVLGQALDD